eukprot:TRINITY_DN1900_c1_g1_i1.p1 TRINITY_DN1900_c1_g1~~TRINITY_DN1900_c1_g1_i1.p1  ORF type:complete len:479 (+),score=78.20 TRINITY_DN1900_c1_g1_i1:87-1523(+)
MSGSQGIAWGWDYTLAVDLWRSLHHRFLVDVVLEWCGKRAPAHRLILSVRSLPLAELLEGVPSGTGDDLPVVRIDELMRGVQLQPGVDVGAALTATVESLTTDWMPDLPLSETLLVCELAKRMQVAFVFANASARALTLRRMMPSGSPWGTIANALWTDKESELHRMLTEHAAPGAPVQCPCAELLSELRSDAAHSLTPAACADAAVHVISELLADDWAECSLPPQHLEPLILDAALGWSALRPAHDAAAVLRLVKVPLIPDDHVRHAVDRHRLPLPLLAGISDADAPPGTPGTALWRRSLRGSGSRGTSAVAPCDAAVYRQKPRAGRDPSDDEERTRRRVDFSPQGSTDRSAQDDVDEIAAPPPAHHQQQQRVQRPARSSCRATPPPPSSSRQHADAPQSGWPDSVLQNSGRPPPRYTERRVSESRGHSQATLSTMLWESSLRPSSSSARQRSSSAAGRDSPPTGPRGTWRGPRAIS